LACAQDELIALDHMPIGRLHPKHLAHAACTEHRRAERPDTHALEYFDAELPGANGKGHRQVGG
jgi:hypothetical protein